MTEREPSIYCDYADIRSRMLGDDKPAPKAKPVEPVVLRSGMLPIPGGGFIYDPQPKPNSIAAAMAAHIKQRENDERAQATADRNAQRAWLGGNWNCDDPTKQTALFHKYARN
jgi:hypothetical protein